MTDKRSLAAHKRFQAAKARQLANRTLDRDFVAQLVKYAEECENDALLLERQLAQFRENIDRSHRLAGEIGQLAEEARRQLAGLRTKLNPAAAGTAFRCLDCARTTLRSGESHYVCPVCGSLESVSAAQDD